ncbi:MAG: hypothetical protein IH880_03650 [Candidatus Marinimicrobia bacterium]|nr:hypothetical protein [Candidatus Neomarinimicrobiota bacterium]
MPGQEIQAIGDGIQMGHTDYGLITLYENGHMEFTHKINRHFCYNQSDQEYEIRPRLYPYPVIEFPTTFLKLWWAILTKFSPEEDFVINLQYRNIKGTILRPYAPGSTGFDYSFHDPTPYENNHIKLPQLKINLKSEPDLIAFELTRRVYRKYGLSVTEIPFFDKENKLFIFGEQ